MTISRFPSSAATLGELLRVRATDTPHRLAFAEGSLHLTFRELFEQASAIAAGLSERGVSSRDRVALSLPAGLGFIRVFWALQLIGAVPCALNPYTPPANIVRRALRVRPRLLITHETEVAKQAVEAGVEALVDADLPRASRVLRPVHAEGEEIAILQTTSGTSGEPRAAMIRHRNVLASVAGAVEALGFGPNDVLASWVPPWHDLGLIRFVVGSVYFGAACHIIQPAIQTIPEWLRTIARERCTVTGAPDFAYRLAARLVNPATVDLSSLTNATSGGEPVRMSTIEAFESTFGLQRAVAPGYGLAESTLGVTCVRRGAPLRTDARGNVSCGTVLPGVELRIDAPRGEAGEILVRGPVVFAGYFDADEATSHVLRDGWLHTGDIGQLDSEGHLYVLGRERAMLKRGGAILAPRELEEAAQSVPGVKIAVAVGLTSAFATEEIALAVEVDEREDRQRIVRDVAASVRDALGFAPERVILLKRNGIPRTHNGKLRHNALREALMAGTHEDFILSAEPVA